MHIHTGILKKKMWFLNILEHLEHIGIKNWEKICPRKRSFLYEEKQNYWRSNYTEIIMFDEKIILKIISHVWQKIASQMNRAAIFQVRMLKRNQVFP